MPRPDIDINNPEDVSRARADHDWWVQITPPQAELVGWTDRQSALFGHPRGSFEVSGVMAEYVHSLLNLKETK